MNGVGMLKWQIGNVKITQLVELTTSSLGPYLLPQATPEVLGAINWMQPFVDEEHKLLLSMHSLIVESQGQVIMVDTCIGNDKQRNYPRWNMMQSDFMDRFAQAGFAADKVDTVLCTHMHVDHVGWSTRWADNRWVPTFSGADYLYAQAEWDHWRTEEQEYGPVIEDSVQPIFDAGKAVLVQTDHVVTDEVRLMSTPGHTPGHVSVHIASAGEEAIITGDMIHHPCQIKHPDWSSLADHDPQRAATTRGDFVRTHADQPVLIIGTHFAGPTAGKIVSDGGSYRLDY